MSKEIAARRVVMTEMADVIAVIPTALGVFADRAVMTEVRVAMTVDRAVTIEVHVVTIEALAVMIVANAMTMTEAHAATVVMTEDRAGTVAMIEVREVKMRANAEREDSTASLIRGPVATEVKDHVVPAAKSSAPMKVQPRQDRVVVASGMMKNNQ